MKKFLFAAALCLPFGTAMAEEKPTLTVYTYDSFVSDWGPGPQIKAAFEAECDCTLEFVSAGDGAAVLSRLRLEGARTEAETAIKSMMDRWMADREFVSREEFEAVRLMAQKAREECTALEARIAALEAK